MKQMIPQLVWIISSTDNDLFLHRTVNILNVGSRWKKH